MVRISLRTGTMTVTKGSGDMGALPNDDESPLRARLAADRRHDAGAEADAPAELSAEALGEPARLGLGRAVAGVRRPLDDERHAVGPVLDELRGGEGPALLQQLVQEPRRDAMAAGEPERVAGPRHGRRDGRVRDAARARRPGGQPRPQ